jgi:tetratricopeptide (TPR) repeat protein
VGEPSIAPARAAVALLLAVATVAVFWPVAGHEFVSFDDDVYVTGNPEVRRGLTADTVRWAWTATRAANWHPLTWTSHMLDVELHGLDPGGHHLTSLLLHAASTVLLFLALARASGEIWPSAFVAALFGVHPLHVESVAWVAERKDVLSTLFLVLTILAHLRYVERRSLRRYGLVALSLAAGLCAKPMLVTAPLVLLLLDFWPLGRMTRAPGGELDARLVRRCLAEKLALVPLVAASAILTLQAQARGGALRTLVEYSLGARMANAVVAGVAYLIETIWPLDLAVFHPHPGDGLQPWKVVGSATILLSVSAVAFRLRRRRPYLLAGWLWYLVTVLPVSGLVQVGEQARADRYTYVPLIGVFSMVAWAAADAARARPAAARRVGLALGVLVLLLGLQARAQVRHWRDSATLFEHALAVTGRNALAHIHLGLACERAGRRSEAIEHYEQAIRDDPGYAPMALHGLGLVLAGDGRLSEAIERWEQALRLDPGSGPAHHDLGRALLAQGRVDEALEHLHDAVRIDAHDAQAHDSLGLALAERGRLEDAVRHYREALRLDPRHAGAHGNLGSALERLGRSDEAIGQFEEALRLDPALAPVHNNLARALGQRGRRGEAIEHLETAVRLRPDYAIAHYNLATALFLEERFAEAWREVALARRHGFEPPAAFVDQLQARMPAP